MKRFDARIIWGILLVLGGFFFLFQNLGLLSITFVLWPFLFGVIGLVFLSVFLTAHSENWWAAIPGLTLLGLTALIGLEEWVPRVGRPCGAPIFLGSIGLAFWVVYLSNRENWWAVIPGGVLATLALVTGLSSLRPFRGVATGGVFLIGLGLTFGLLSLLPVPEGDMKWSLIPAAILGLIGFLIIITAMAIMSYIWPLALILVGLYLLYRILTTRR
jgi:hypothetical protein